MCREQEFFNKKKDTRSAVQCCCVSSFFSFGTQDRSIFEQSFD